MFTLNIFPFDHWVGRRELVLEQLLAQKCVQNDLSILKSHQWLGKLEFVLDWIASLVYAQNGYSISSFILEFSFLFFYLTYLEYRSLSPVG